MSVSISDPLLALIKDQGLIDDLQLDEVIQEHNKSGKPITEILVESAIMDLETQLNMIAEYLGTEVVTGLKDTEIPPEVVASVPSTTARMYQCMPIGVYDHAIRVVLVDPLNPATLDEISFIVGKEVHAVVAEPKVILDLIEKYYQEASESFADIMLEFGGDEADMVREIEALEEEASEDALTNMANDTPIVRFVNLVFYQAVMDRASDIHYPLPGGRCPL
jgi:type IV pilus assembly protein PilB